MAQVTDDEVLKQGNVKVLTVSEVSVLMDTIVTRTQQRDADYQPNAMLLKAQEYAARFSHCKNRDTLQKIRELLASHHLSELELGLVANLEIETADEAKKLVPTLDMATESREAFSDEQLETLLKELATYREFE